MGCLLAVFPPLGEAQTHRYKRVLPTGCPFSRILGDFGLCASTKKGGEMVEMTFSKNDTGPFGVSLEVFVARSEAPSSRFDLRRGVCFTDPRCACHTMHALQKEVGGVQRWCTNRREPHPLQPGPDTKS